MKKAIVTGATGFIGKWLVKELLDNDIHVTAIIRNKNKLPSELLSNRLFDYIECDFNYIDSIQIKNEYDCFYHIAWGGVDGSHKNDVDIQIYNIKMSMQMIDLAAKIGVKKFVATGTVAEYVFCRDILDVNAKQTPNDMYGAAKTATHYFLQVRARQLGINFIWTILPSTFGEYRDDNNIITYTIKELLNKKVPEYGNLQQMWDFLYVSDVTRALRLVGEKGNSGMTYGIGSGIYRPLRDYITTIRDIINPKLRLDIGKKEEMSKQTFSSCVSIVELSRDTGFYPSISFEDGIRRTIKYWEAKGEQTH